MGETRVLGIVRAEAEQQQQPDKKEKKPENIPGKFAARDANLNLDKF